MGTNLFSQTSARAQNSRKGGVKMKRTIMVLLAIIFCNSVCWAVEVAPRISDREIVERLTRLEEGQKAILREMDKRFESIDNRFELIDNRFESIDKRFDQLINVLIAIISAFAGIVAVTIGFAIWDRRTMIRPFETTVNALEKNIQGFDEEKLTRLIGALRKFADSNKDIAEALKTYNLM